MDQIQINGRDYFTACQTAKETKTSLLPQHNQTVRHSPGIRATGYRRIHPPATSPSCTPPPRPTRCAERGQQGTSKGYPGTAARNAVMAMAWLEFVLFLAAGCTVIYDRYAYRRWRILTDHTRSKLEMEEAAQFKQAYATTQVGSIPLV